jgi:hypothetical protein
MKMDAPEIIAAIWGLSQARPQLLAQHLRGYVMLMHTEATLAATYLRYRLCMWVAFLVCSIMFLLLLGIALMLWGTTTNSALIHEWIFVLVPSIPLVGLILIGFALSQQPPHSFGEALETQIAADMTMLNKNVD